MVCEEHIVKQAFTQFIVILALLIAMIHSLRLPSPFATRLVLQSFSAVCTPGPLIPVRSPFLVLLHILALQHLWPAGALQR